MDFSATDSVLGYLYQCRYALVGALRRLRADGTVTVSLETLDDIVFTTAGGRAELVQVKHSRRRVGIITEGSSQLWRTLRVWLSGMADGSIADDAAFFLVTTAVTSPGSAPAFLTAHSFDAERAEILLTRHAQSARATAGNRVGYDLYLATPRARRLDLLRRVLIVEGQPNIIEIDAALATECRLSRPSRHERVAERLGEWWYARCVQSLISARPIPGAEIEAELEDIVDALRPELLPLDFEPGPTAGDHQGATFLRQLDLVGVSEPGCRRALRDYLRASALRLRWQREHLIGARELTAYDERLIEAWEPRHEAMTERLNSRAQPGEVIAAGRELYRWVELEASEFIRPTCPDRGVTRGSYHLLAQDFRIGWHRDFLALLRDNSQEEAS